MTQLENNEATLLMYLANELPAEDRAEVEQLLERDENLRAQLADLRDAYSAMETVVSRADASTPLPSAFASARSFGDLVRQRALARGSVDENENGHRRGRWIIYPIAAAAAVALGMLVWWQSATQEQSLDPALMAGRYNPYFTDSQEAAALSAWDPPAPDPVQEDLERQFEVLAYLRSESFN